MRRLEPLRAAHSPRQRRDRRRRTRALEDALRRRVGHRSCSRPSSCTITATRSCATCNRPALVVVDEAHHLFESRHRPAYGTLRRAHRSARLAAGAGADRDGGTRSVCARPARASESSVGHRPDGSRESARRRSARQPTSSRGSPHRRNMDAAGKAIVYCNSRSEATKIAEKLRVPCVGDAWRFITPACRLRSAAGRAALSRGRDPRRRRDVGVRRGHRSARRARRVSLPSQLQFHRVQPAGRPRGTRRRCRRASICSSASDDRAQRIHHRARRADAADAARTVPWHARDRRPDEVSADDV